MSDRTAMCIELDRAHRFRSLERYCAALDAGLNEKLQVIGPWLRAWPSAPLVDVGAGAGAVSAWAARQYPAASVIGIDVSVTMLEIAKRRHHGQCNLSFRQGNAGEAHAENAASIILCSVLHEVYSYHGDTLAAVTKAVEAAWSSLRPGGRLIIRDFVKPQNGDQPVLLCHCRSDIVPGHDFLSFARAFARPIRSRLRDGAPGVFVYETDLASAYEYILRKNYHEMWHAELQERYGFWTATEARDLVQSVGFVVLHSEELSNPWLEQNSLWGKIALSDCSTGRSLRLPAAQLLLVAEKR